MKPEIGAVFGRLRVVSNDVQSKNRQAMCRCVCECGNIKDIAASYLRRGLIKSCGCLAREVTGAMSRTHGMSKSPEYAVWCRMHERCTNPRVARYSRYGGRGIKVCERWARFENFYADMGPLPSRQHSIGRIDNDGDYTPDNCRWETSIEQANNKESNTFLEWNGKRQTISEWSREIGVSQKRISYRHSIGLSLDEVLSSKKNLVERPICFGGEQLLTTEWMRKLSIPISSFYYHRRRGRSDEEIIGIYAEKHRVD